MTRTVLNSFYSELPVERAWHLSITEPWGDEYTEFMYHVSIGLVTYYSMIAV